MLKRLSIIILIAISFGALTGCASIVSGTHQSVSVRTGSVTGASCSLENNKGRWYVSNTPASVVVNRSFNDLHINCEKKGYRRSFRQVASNTKAMAFGNAVFGGVIGAGIDMADGAAYDYPADIDIPMQKGFA